MQKAPYVFMVVVVVVIIIIVPITKSSLWCPLVTDKIIVDSTI